MAVNAFWIRGSIAGKKPSSVDASWRAHFDARLASTPGRTLVARAPGLPLTNGDLARSLQQAFTPAAHQPSPSPSPTAAGSHDRDVLAEAAIQARVYKL